MVLLAHNTIKIVNRTEYPDAEVKRIIQHEVKQAELHLGVTFTVGYRPEGDGWASGYWRPYWYPGEDRPQISIRLPRPGVPVHDCVPSPRKRE